MCGICGIIGELDNSRKVLKNMMDKIAHRGPMMKECMWTSMRQSVTEDLVLLI